MKKSTSVTKILSQARGRHEYAGIVAEIRQISRKSFHNEIKVGQLFAKKYINLATSSHSKNFKSAATGDWLNNQHLSFYLPVHYLHVYQKRHWTMTASSLRIETSSGFDVIHAEKQPPAIIRTAKIYKKRNTETLHSRSDDAAKVEVRLCCDGEEEQLCELVGIKFEQGKNCARLGSMIILAVDANVEPLSETRVTKLTERHETELRLSRLPASAARWFDCERYHWDFMSEDLLED